VTLPDTAFVCENIDVEAGTRHWVEEIEGEDWDDMPPPRRLVLMQRVEAIVAAALGEVIPAEVKTRWHCDTCRDLGRGPEQHYRTRWQPVVSDKEQQ
jgi:hypothetical protein